MTLYLSVSGLLLFGTITSLLAKIGKQSMWCGLELLLPGLQIPIYYSRVLQFTS